MSGLFIFIFLAGLVTYYLNDIFLDQNNAKSKRKVNLNQIYHRLSMHKCSDTYAFNIIIQRFWEEFKYSYANKDRIKRIMNKQFKRMKSKLKGVNVIDVKIEGDGPILENIRIIHENEIEKIVKSHELITENDLFYDCIDELSKNSKFTKQKSTLKNIHFLLNIFYPGLISLNIIANFMKIKINFNLEISNFKGPMIIILPSILNHTKLDVCFLKDPNLHIKIKNIRINNNKYDKQINQKIILENEINFFMSQETTKNNRRNRILSYFSHFIIPIIKYRILGKLLFPNYQSLTLPLISTNQNLELKIPDYHNTDTKIFKQTILHQINLFFSNDMKIVKNNKNKVIVKRNDTNHENKLWSIEIPLDHNDYKIIWKKYGIHINDDEIEKYYNINSSNEFFKFDIDETEDTSFNSNNKSSRTTSINNEQSCNSFHNEIDNGKYIETKFDSVDSIFLMKLLAPENFKILTKHLNIPILNLSFYNYSHSLYILYLLFPNLSHLLLISENSNIHEFDIIIPNSRPLKLLIIFHNDRMIIVIPSYSQFISFCIKKQIINISFLLPLNPFNIYKMKENILNGRNIHIINDISQNINISNNELSGIIGNILYTEDKYSKEDDIDFYSKNEYKNLVYSNMENPNNNLVQNDNTPFSILKNDIFFFVKSLNPYFIIIDKKEININISLLHVNFKNKRILLIYYKDENFIMLIEKKNKSLDEIININMDQMRNYSTIVQNNYIIVYDSSNLKLKFKYSSQLQNNIKDIFLSIFYFKSVLHNYFYVENNTNNCKIDYQDAIHRTRSIHSYLGNSDLMSNSKLYTSSSSQSFYLTSENKSFYRIKLSSKIPGIFKLNMKNNKFKLIRNLCIDTAYDCILGLGVSKYDKIKIDIYTVNKQKYFLKIEPIEMYYHKTKDLMLNCMSVINKYTEIKVNGDFGMRIFWDINYSSCFNTYDELVITLSHSQASVVITHTGILQCENVEYRLKIENKSKVSKRLKMFSGITCEKM